MTGNSKIFALMRKKSTNLIEDFTDGIVNNMMYHDRNILYPNDIELDPKSGVKVEWFYPMFKDPTGYSEIDAIHMYITQEAIFEDLGETLMGIALVEMKHLDKLADVIDELGGKLDRNNSTNHINYGKTPKEAIDLAIKSEQDTIKGYEDIIDKVRVLPKNDTTNYILQLLAKLIADETYHITLLNKVLEDSKKKIIIPKKK